MPAKGTDIFDRKLSGATPVNCPINLFCRSDVNYIFCAYFKFLLLLLFCPPGSASKQTNKCPNCVIWYFWENFCILASFKTYLAPHLHIKASIISVKRCSRSDDSHCTDWLSETTLAKFTDLFLEKHRKGRFMYFRPKYNVLFKGLPEYGPIHKM